MSDGQDYPEERVSTGYLELICASLDDNRLSVAPSARGYPLAFIESHFVLNRRRFRMVGLVVHHDRKRQKSEPLPDDLCRISLRPVFGIVDCFQSAEAETSSKVSNAPIAVIGSA